MQLSEIKARLQELNAEGFVPTLRSGPTGIGHTLETRLGLTENNLPIPDIGGRVEVKATRNSSNNLITLFTFNRAVWRFRPHELIERWGYVDQRGRESLYTTVSATEVNNLGLQLSVKDDTSHLYLAHVSSDTVLATWDMYYIIGKFVSKFGRMLFVHADSRRINRREEFHFTEAAILSEPGARTFRDCFYDGKVMVDIRMHLRTNGSARNHGTAFRIREHDLPNLFGNAVRIL